MAGNDIECLLLAAVEVQEISDTWKWCASAGVEHTAVVGCMKSLTVDAYVTSEPINTEFWQLTEEADNYILKGSPEVQLFHSVPEGGADEAALKAAVGEETVKIGLGKCMKNKWLVKDKASGKLVKLVSPFATFSPWRTRLTPTCPRVLPLPRRSPPWTVTSS
jgi:phenylalanyl-tRNA synthetase alpha chain